MIACDFVIDEVIEIGPTCGDANGSITIIASGNSGPLLYRIFGGSFTSDNHFDNLIDNDYLITVVDASGCSENISVQLVNTSMPVIDLLERICVSDVGDSNIDIEMTGGIAPYSYQWLGPAGFSSSLGDQQNVAPGNYQVTIEDAIGCQLDTSIVITALIPTMVSMSCPLELVLECNDPNNDAIVQNWIGEVSAKDSDGNNLAIKNDYAGVTKLDCDNIFTINFEVYNDCGLLKKCSSDIKLYDTTSPEVNLPADLSISYDDTNYQTTIRDWLFLASADDSCTDPVLKNDFFISNLNFDCATDLVFPVTFTATDECLNEGKKIGNIVIKGAASVSLVCDPTLALSCDDPHIDTKIQDWLASVSFESSLPYDTLITNDYTPIVNEDCYVQSIVTFESVDRCGNPINYQGEIIIEDRTAPEVVCLEDINMEASVFDINIIYEWLESIEVSDNCGAVDLSYEFDENLLYDQCNILVPITFVAKDNCDNVITCISAYTIIDTIVPEIICADDFTMYCGDMEYIDILNRIQETIIEDNSDVVSYDYDFDASDLDDYDCNREEPLMIPIVATDLCGNESTCILKVIFPKDVDVYIPNIFVPGLEGDNNILTVHGNENVISIESFEIFDRDGVTVFNEFDVPINDPFYGWDGKVGDTYVFRDQYVYRLVVNDRFGDQHYFEGSIIVMR